MPVLWVLTKPGSVRVPVGRACEARVKALQGSRRRTDAFLAATPMRKPTLLLLAALAAACSRGPASRQDPPSTAPPSRRDPPAVSVAQDPVPEAPLADAFKGTIAPDLGVFMRLAVDPATGHVSGRYFYASKGVDLPLAGLLTKDGTLTLEETSGDRTTGRFVGRRAPDGGVAGTWSDPAGKHSLAFTLIPIPRVAGAPAVIARKQSHVRRRVKDAPAGIAPWEVADMAAPELFGLADPKVEARINARLARELRIDDRGDPMSEDIKSDYAVTINRDGLLGLRFDGYDDCRQCAHPSTGGKTMNLSLATGEEIPFDRLFVRGGKAKLRAIVAAAYKPTEPDLDDQVIDACLAGDYALHDTQLELVASFQLPHAIQALDPDLHIPYAKLGAILDPASPAAAAWRKP